MITIGKILKPFGVRGEVKIYSYSDFSEERFATGKKLVVQNETNDKKELTILSSRCLQSPCWAIHFQEIHNIDEAEKLRDFFLLINEKDIPPLKEGEYYSRELLHCSVYQNNQKIGIVQEINEGVSCNYLRVLIENNKTKLIPFLPAFILSVDKEGKRIDIVDLEGLI